MKKENIFNPTIYIVYFSGAPWPIKKEQDGKKNFVVSSIVPYILPCIHS